MAEEKKSAAKEAEKEETAQEDTSDKKQETKEEEVSEGSETEVPEKFKKLVGEIEEMSVLELSELVKVLEKKFGVSAAAPVAVAGVGAPAEANAAEEKSEFDVELAEAGGNKIAVIKAVRSATGLGLKEAKDIVDAAPKMIKEGVAKEDAEKMKAELEEAGAKVNLK